MSRILVTGGAVHGKLDSVKIVTNRFQGGRAAGLADSLAALGHDVVWLSSKFSKTPRDPRVERVLHDGFFDYMEKAPEIGKSCQGAVMAAAVANLVPQNPWPNKFPSHDYEEGEVVQVPFVVAPRVIGRMRRANPNLFLFGFKLLDAPREELVAAAYKTLLESGCRAVFANHPASLDEKLAVMPDRSVHPMLDTDLPGVVHEMMGERLFSTVQEPEGAGRARPGEVERFKSFLAARARDGRFVSCPEGYVFGAAIMPLASGGMLCSSRGKDESAEFTEILDVDFERLVVRVAGKKASLNAPLMWRFARANPGAPFALHAHDRFDGSGAQPWRGPGTEGDSLREIQGPFLAIKGHGCVEAWSSESERSGGGEAP